jgi:putative oxidoreductase
MTSLLSKATALVHNRVLPALDALSCLPVLGMRLWIANVFWKSGMSKLNDWQGTVALFADEYQVPLISPELAAYAGTGGELIAPVLVAAGFGARLGAAGMLFMTGVIEFTYLSFPIHVVWALMLALIVFQGAGKLSIDHLIRRKLGNA